MGLRWCGQWDIPTQEHAVRGPVPGVGELAIGTTGQLRGFMHAGWGPWRDGAAVRRTTQPAALASSLEFLSFVLVQRPEPPHFGGEISSGVMHFDIVAPRRVL